MGGGGGGVGQWGSGADLVFSAGVWGGEQNSF